MAHPLATALARAEQQTETSLTDKAREEGSYRKGKLTWNDIPIAIENPKGSIRTGVGRDGKRWFCEMPAAYGEVRRSEGQDGDPVDVYVGPAHGSKRVWVIDQVDADTGRSDEHKCLLAFPNKDAALKAYEASFSDGKAKQRIGAVTELSVAEFRDFLKNGDTTKPMSQQKKSDKALEVAQRYTKGYAYGGRVGYAEGGPAGEIASEMTRDLRRDRQRRALAGRELTPDEEAAYADYVARLPERREMKARELDGFTSGIGDLLTPGETLPMMDARTRRQIAARSLAGRDLTYDQMRELADQEAVNEERSARLGVPLGIAATELTGVPSIMRGGSNVVRGIEERDPARIAGGALEGVIGAAPLGMVARPVAAALKPLTGSVPRFTATSMGASGLTSYADDAKAAERNVATRIASDPEVKAIIDKRTAALAEIQRVQEDLIAKNPAIQALEAKRAQQQLLRKATNDKYAKAGPETQKQALAPFDEEIKRINGQIQEISDGALKPYKDEVTRLAAALGTAEDRARAAYMDEATFREKYPGVPMALMAGGLGVAGALPLMKAGLGRVTDSWKRKSIEDATTKTENAFAGGLSDAETAIAQQRLQRHLDRWDADHGKIAGGWNFLANTGKGALLGAEASQLPEQLDYLTNAPGHPAREAAVKQLQNPEYWKERWGPALLGAGSAIMGHTAAHMIPQNREFLVPAREVASRGAEPSRVDALLAKLHGRSKPEGPTEDAIKQVQRYRSAVGPSGAREDAKMLEGLLDTPPGSGAPLPRPTSPELTALPSPSVIPPSAQAPSPSRSPEALSNLESAASKASDVIKQSKRSADMRPWEGAPPKGVKLPKGTLWDANMGRTRREDGTLGPAPRYSAPRKKDNPQSLPKSEQGEGKASGGIVGRVFDVVRRYAGGGRVVPHGLMAGDTPGRSDKLPVQVPNGAYVLPADFVSGLGEGNTMAGSKRFKEMSPPPAPGFARGGHVEIMISDGEEVVHPDVVAAWGGGDLDRGHKVLDQMVRQGRSETIRKLASLPPPAK